MLDKDLLEKAYQRIVNEKKSEFETGFVDLDNVLSGVEKGALITIGARPAMGKTTLVTSILEHLIKSNKKVLFFTFQQSKLIFLTKLLAQIAEVSAIKTRFGNISEEEGEKLLEAKEILANSNLELVSKTMSVDEVVEKIRESNAEYVFIDGLQLIKINLKKQISDELANVASKLKEVAEQKGIYIISTTQLSRALESRCDKRPMLADIRSSGAIEEFSDVVMFIYRPEYYDAEDEYHRGQAEIIVAKNNFGHTVNLSLVFKSMIPKFYTMESSLYAEF